MATVLVISVVVIVTALYWHQSISIDKLPLKERGQVGWHLQLIRDLVGTIGEPD